MLNAGALLVVLGAALLMEAVGLSMGLFFLAAGMSLNLTEHVPGDIMSGRDKMLTAPVPEPLTPGRTAAEGRS